MQFGDQTLRMRTESNERSNGIETSLVISNVQERTRKRLFYLVHPWRHFHTIVILADDTHRFHHMLRVVTILPAPMGKQHNPQLLVVNRWNRKMCRWYISVVHFDIIRR